LNFTAVERLVEEQPIIGLAAANAVSDAPELIRNFRRVNVILCTVCLSFHDSSHPNPRVAVHPTKMHERQS
jgi:hypothetical protein